MRTEELPSPGIGTLGFKLRNDVVNVISQLEIASSHYPGQKHPSAADVSAFLEAAMAAFGNTPTPTPTPTGLVSPRVAMVGPSTLERSVYADQTSGDSRSGHTAAGPLVWALSVDRRARHYLETLGAYPWYNGDNFAVGGAVLSEYGPQITKAAARLAEYPDDDWIVIYDPGRNDATAGEGLATYQSYVPGHLSALKSAGFAYILLMNLPYRDPSYGGVWAIGGAARDTVDEINDWLADTYSDDPQIRIIDMQGALMDPASAPDLAPYADAYRSDATHLTNKGGWYAGQPFVTALADICEPAPTYPVDPPGRTIAPFSAGGGTITGNAASGTVANGWTAVASSSLSVVASLVTEDGHTWQRFTITGLNSIPANGRSLTFALNAPAVLGVGAKKGMRARVRKNSCPSKWTLYHLFGTSTANGDPAASRTFGIVGIIDNTTNSFNSAANANFAGAPGFPSEALDLWLETPAYVLGDGSAVGAYFALVVGPGGGSGDSLILDFADVQDFDWPI